MPVSTWEDITRSKAECWPKTTPSTLWAAHAILFTILLGRVLKRLLQLQHLMQKTSVLICSTGLTGAPNGNLLAEYYQFCDVEYRKIKQVNTRWLSLETAINRNLQHNNGLKSYFVSE